MSENNLNEEIRVTVEDAPAITVNTPLVHNLTADNAAPTAKTVGDALALKVNADDVMEHVTITFDGIESDNQGVLLVSAEDIPLTDSTTVNPQTGAGSIKKELERIDGKTAADIAYGLNVTVKDRIDAMAGSLADVQSGMRGDEIPIDGTTGAQSVKDAIDEVDAKTAADIPYVTGTSVLEKIGTMDTAIAAVQTAAGSAVKVTAQSLTDGEKVQARANIGAVARTEAVLLDAQTLTTSQQSQARANIGALGAADVADVVRTSEQTLTTAQHAQARANIGIIAETPASETVALGSGLSAVFTKCGKVCSMYISGQLTTGAAQWASIGTIPEAYLPFTDNWAANISDFNGYIAIHPSGTIQAGYTIAANAWVIVNLTYICL